MIAREYTWFDSQIRGFIPDSLMAGYLSAPLCRFYLSANTCMMQMQQPLVVIESPLSGDFARNVRYARLCGLDCIRRGEAPYASHLLMTQFLDDALPEERKLGMEAGFAWGAKGDIVAVYQDLGISGGMRMGIENAERRGQKIEYRRLPSELMSLLDVGAPTKTAGID